MYADVKLVLCDVCLIIPVLPITCCIVLTNDGKIAHICYKLRFKWNALKQKPKMKMDLSQ